MPPMTDRSRYHPSQRLGGVSFTQAKICVFIILEVFMSLLNLLLSRLNNSHSQGHGLGSLYQFGKIIANIWEAVTMSSLVVSMLYGD